MLRRLDGYLIRSLMVVCLLLSILCSPSHGQQAEPQVRNPVVYSDPFENFLCFPPIDDTPCEEVASRYPGLNRMSDAIWKKCGASIKDPELHEKYAISLSLLYFGWPIFCVYAWSELGEDLGKCVVKGLLEYAGMPQYESLVDAAWIASNLRDFKNKIMSLKDKIPPELLLAAKDRGKDGYDTVKGLSEIKDLKELYNEYSGLPGIARNRLIEADALINSCLFEEAEQKIIDAESRLTKYCEGEGKSYRWYEKNIRCLKEEHKAWLRKLFPENAPYDPLSGWSRKEKGGTIGPRAIAAVEAEFKENSRKQESLLRQYRREIFVNLGLFNEIEKKKALLEERKKTFRKMEDDYNKVVGPALEYLRSGNLMAVCHAIKKINEIEEALPSTECVGQLDWYSEELSYKDFLIRSLESQIQVLLEVANDWLRQAEAQMKPPCKLDEAQVSLESARNTINSLLFYENGRCVPYPETSELNKRYAALSKHLEEIRRNAARAKALLLKAENLAKDLCTCDQALTGETAERKILEWAEKGCMTEDDVRARLSRIKRIAREKIEDGDKLEKDIYHRLEQATQWINPKTPACEVKKALGSLGQARQIFNRCLNCSGNDPEPSPKTMERSERIKTTLEAAKGMVEERAEIISRAKAGYAQKLDSVIAGTDDICRFKEVLKETDKDALRTLAADFCAEKKAETDIREMETEIQKLSRRVDQDLDALERAAEKTENEKDCQHIRNAIKKGKENSDYLKDCDEYRGRIDFALSRMQHALTERETLAAQVMNKAVEEGQHSLSRCIDMTAALELLKNSADRVHRNCIDRNLLSRADALVEDLDNEIRDVEARRRGIKVLCSEAREAVRICDWNAVKEQISEAEASLPGQPCYGSHPVFAELEAEVGRIKEESLSRAALVERYRVEIQEHLLLAEGYLKVDPRNQKDEKNRFEGYNREKRTLKRIADQAGAEGVADCLSEIIAAAGALPEIEYKEREKDGGFKSSGGEKTVKKKGFSSSGGEARVVVDQPKPTDPGSGKKCPPGSRFVWNPFTGENKCSCPEGSVWKEDRTGCVSCSSLDSRFQAQLASGDIDSASRILSWAKGCAFYEQAASALRVKEDERRDQNRAREHDRDCKNREYAILRSLSENRLSNAQDLLQKARANGCRVSSRIVQAVKEAQTDRDNRDRKRQTDILCNQLRLDLEAARMRNAPREFKMVLSHATQCPFYQEGLSILRDMETRRRIADEQERCRQIEDALKAAQSRKDVNRFRALLDRAQNCPFFGQARGVLQNMERQIQLEKHCRSTDAALKSASRAKDISRFRSLLSGAKSCGFYREALSYLKKWEEETRREAECGNLYKGLQNAFRSKNVNRYRSILNQAKGCPFYSQALADLNRLKQRQCNRRTKCQEYVKGRGWVKEIHGVLVGTPYGSHEVSCSKPRPGMHRCWDECAKKWRCFGYR